MLYSRSSGIDIIRLEHDISTCHFWLFFRKAIRVDKQNFTITCLASYVGAESQV